MIITIRANVPLGIDAVAPLMPGEVGTIDRTQEEIDLALSLNLYEVVEVVADPDPEPESTNVPTEDVEFKVSDQDTD